MNLNEINSNFIAVLKTKLPNSNISLLEEILPMSREAIYRRLRGEVQFSYSEAVLIASKLNMSLDELINNDGNSFTFKFIQKSDNLVENHYIGAMAYDLSEILGDEITPTAHLYFCGTKVPIPFVFNYKTLIKFRFYKWMYENKKIETNKTKFSEISIPSNLYELSNIHLNKFRKLNTTLILSDGIFEKYLKDVKHFVDLEIINDFDKKSIKEDLLSLINEFETVTSLGKYKEGGDFSLFLLDTDLDSSFGYFINGDSTTVFNYILSLNYVASTSSLVSEKYISAFNNLKDYGILISQSAPTKRIDFFERQRRIVNEFF